MSESLQADLLLRVDWLAQTTGGVEQPSANGILEYARHLAAGALASQLEKRWVSSRTLAGGASETLDLQSLTYTALGLTSTVSFSVVRAIVVVMRNDLAGLKIGGVAANEWFAPWVASGRGQLCGPGSPAVIADAVNGWAVSAGAKGLLLTNQSATDEAEFDIVILGN